MTNFTRGLILGVFVLALPAAGWAYQPARVGNEAATVYTAPSQTAAPAGTVPAGTLLNVSDAPRGGFYQCAAGNGVRGWIAEDAIVLSHPKKVAAKVQKTAEPSAETSQFKLPKQGQGLYYGGLMGGLGVESGGSLLALGVDGGVKLAPQFGVGLYATYYGIGLGASTIIVAGEGNYFFGDQLKGLYATAKGGLGLSLAPSVSVTVPSITGTGVATQTVGGGTSVGVVLGGGAGYDYKLTNEISVGGEGNVLLMISSATGVIFNALADVKYWF